MSKNACLQALPSVEFFEAKPQRTLPSVEFFEALTSENAAFSFLLPEGESNPFWLLVSNSTRGLSPCVMCVN